MICDDRPRLTNLKMLSNNTCFVPLVQFCKISLTKNVFHPDWFPIQVYTPFFCKQVTEVGIKTTGQMIVTKARFVSTSQVECSVSSEETKSSYIISISNDGINFNQTVVVVAFSPDCRSCDLDSMTCTLHVSLRFILFLCFTPFFFFECNIVDPGETLYRFNASLDYVGSLCRIFA